MNLVMQAVNIHEAPGQLATWVIASVAALALALGAIKGFQALAKAGPWVAIITIVVVGLIAWGITKLPGAPEAFDGFISQLLGGENEFKNAPRQEAPPAGS